MEKEKEKILRDLSLSGTLSFEVNMRKEEGNEYYLLLTCTVSRPAY
jgi:hypothetical protein